MRARTLFFVVACRGCGIKAGEAERINIGVKKAASVVRLNVDSLEARQREDDDHSELHLRSTPPTSVRSDAVTFFSPPPLAHATRL